MNLTVDSLFHITPGFTANEISALGVERTEHGFMNASGIAVVEIIGPTTKYAGWFSSSTLQIRNQLRKAVSDDTVRGIMLFVDSPGGQVAGSEDLASDVLEASQVKPLYAYASDMMASAAYHVSSQAGQIYANRGAMIGSIGTMMALYDVSKYFENLGIQAVPITSGGMKGAGMLGTPITAEIKAYFQGLIDEVTNYFVADVARGRAMSESQVRSLADGRIHLASQAQELGLIDGVMSLPQAINQMQTTFFT